MMRKFALSVLLAALVSLSACDPSRTTGEDGAVGGDGEGSDGGPDFGEVGDFSAGLTVRLEKTFEGADTVSFGVPVAAGTVTDPSQVRVSIGGTVLAASVRTLLSFHDAEGASTGPRALLIQFPASLLASGSVDVDISWTGGDPSGAPSIPFESFESLGLSAVSPEAVATAGRTIQNSSGVNSLVETSRTDRTLFSGREPMVLAAFPAGYLASTGILGQQAALSQAAAPAFAGIEFLSQAMIDFGLSAMYAEDYPVNPDAVVDPVAEYEGWLYDRCTTFLTAYVHTGDSRFLRHAYRSCSYYARKINLSGPDAGIFSGKPDPDPKYSHLRGLYAYYALTGDEGAFEAGRAIAELWYNDADFTGPYREGRIRSPDALWTERLLGTSLEGLYYGHRLTGETKYLTAFREVFETAYRHITGDAAALAAINPGTPAFPPQNCFIHTAAQHAEGNDDEPWCSIWMSELLIDPLLRYQEQTGDERVDEVFIRLSRFLRDVGSAYFTSDLQDDFFLEPSVCDDPGDGENRRRLVPLYGSGLGLTGLRQNFGEYDDFEHCTDATALTAAALRALKRSGGYDVNPVGPFASEGEAVLQLHHEFANCAALGFAYHTRPDRAPSAWTSEELAAGLADPAQFIADNRIGYPVHNIAPQRKISWWFNASLLQFGLLEEAGLAVSALLPGAIQPGGCP